jgi:folate-dependent phosphoribosylglycinamide formyltransferase PurN
MRPKLLVFSSGTRTGGGSGFENLVNASRTDVLRADIVGVVSNHLHGGVAEKAERLGVRFRHFENAVGSAPYLQIATEFAPDFVALSGWLKLVHGLDSRKTFNIHPAPLPAFGGAGFYGIKAHEAVIRAYEQGQLKETELCMHFVTPEYDKGPIFFRHRVPILPGDNATTLQQRVLKEEHKYQPIITDLVVGGGIVWDGVNPDSLVVPELCKQM